MTFSIVIPAFNRPEPLKYTLRSAAEAVRRLGEPAEILLIDDGSDPPLEKQLAGFEPGAAVTWRRQPNQGSIASRLAGLEVARGEFVLFLDSDDLIHPDKLHRHAAALRAGLADLSYDDMAQASLGPGYTATYGAAERLDPSDEIADWALRLQPVPHNPAYRREYLNRALKPPLIPPSRSLDSGGDVWIYYNLAVHPARIAKIAAPLTALGPHQEERFSCHWENIGVSALRVMREFAERCPRTEATLRARTIAGEVAFQSWRRLPKGFHRGYDRATLELWRRAPRGPVKRLGEARFARLAKAIGPEPAARLLRWFFNGRYAACRTLTAEEYRRLFTGAWLA